MSSEEKEVMAETDPIEVFSKVIETSEDSANKLNPVETAVVETVEHQFFEEDEQVSTETPEIEDVDTKPQDTLTGAHADGEAQMAEETILLKQEVPEADEDVHVAVKQEVKEEVKEEVIEEVKEEVKDEVTEEEEVKDKVLEEEEVKENSNEEVKDEVKDEVKNEVTEEVKKESNKEVLEVSIEEEMEVSKEEELVVSKEEAPKAESEVQSIVLDDKKIEKLKEYSDDEIEIDDDISSSNSECEDSSLDSSDSDSSLEEASDIESDTADIDDDGEEASTGPIQSKNEVLDEKAPGLPENYIIPENAPLQLIGEVSGLVERSIIVKANISGEFRILKENSILCFKDRTIIGPLFEIFGRLQLPVYRVKFNSEEEFNKFKHSKGQEVYYVVPDSQFVYTDSIKAIKGTDASNCHDEELPEEEQEFSDDERELAAKQSKKKKRKNKTKPEDDTSAKNQRKRQHGASSGNPMPEVPEVSSYQPYGYNEPPPRPTQQPDTPAKPPVMVQPQTHSLPPVPPPSTYPIPPNPMQFQQQQYGQQAPLAYLPQQPQQTYQPSHQTYQQPQHLHQQQQYPYQQFLHYSHPTSQNQFYSQQQYQSYPQQPQFSQYSQQQFQQYNQYPQQVSQQPQQPQEQVQPVPSQSQQPIQQSQLQQLQQLIANQLQQQQQQQPNQTSYYKPPQ